MGIVDIADRPSRPQHRRIDQAQSQRRRTEESRRENEADEITREILTALLDPMFDGFKRGRLVKFASAVGMVATTSTRRTWRWRPPSRTTPRLPWSWPTRAPISSGALGATAHEIVRLERVAEDVAAAGVGADGFADAARSALQRLER